MEYYLGLDTMSHVLAPLKGTLKTRATISSGKPDFKVTHIHAMAKGMQDSWGWAGGPHRPGTHSEHTTFLGFIPRCMSRKAQSYSKALIVGDLTGRHSKRGEAGIKPASQHFRAGFQDIIP